MDQRALLGGRWVALGLALALGACGYTKDEYDQQVRESERLRDELRQQVAAKEKCDADLAAALREVESLNAALTERGLTVDNLSNDLGRQRKALEEYQLRVDQLDEIRKRFVALKEKLESLTRFGLKVSVRDNRMVIQLPGDVLFASGRADLKKDGEEVLRQVAEVIRADADLSNREFQVAGHTDSHPLRGGPYLDNWGLSAMRARSVVLFLTRPVEEKGFGLDARNWSAAGYGDTDPVVANDTDEHRQQNRRVELVVLPNVGEMLNLDSLLQEGTR
ncbi:MAG: flagellar motor protein MotB [Polyangiaceae bacterium]|nr:flagellar motor protein MotB [Polyangiaceae bacterium]